jgi:hypothetical protein
MKTTIDMAREAGWKDLRDYDSEMRDDLFMGNTDSLNALVALVRADEREAIQALAQPVQEPVAYEYGDDVFWHDSPDINDYIRANGKALVYATPPAAQRQWVGLTDERLLEILVGVDHETKRLPPGMKAYARAIEQAHGITKGQS